LNEGTEASIGYGGLAPTGRGFRQWTTGHPRGEEATLKAYRRGPTGPRL